MTATFTKHYSDVQRITSIPVKGKHEVFSPADKAVYFYLLSLQENIGKVFPSVLTLSRELGIPERTVKRSIKWLQEASLISAQRRYDSSNLYFVNPPHDVMRLAGEAIEPVSKIKIITGTFSAKTIEAVLSVLRKMGVIHGDASPVVTVFTEAKQEPLGSVETESVGVPIDYKVETVKVLTVKHINDELEEDEYEIPGWGYCPSTGNWLPVSQHANKCKEQEPW